MHSPLAAGRLRAGVALVATLGLAAPATASSQGRCAVDGSFIDDSTRETTDLFALADAVEVAVVSGRRIRLDRETLWMADGRLDRGEVYAPEHAGSSLVVAHGDVIAILDAPAAIYCPLEAPAPISLRWREAR